MMGIGLGGITSGSKRIVTGVSSEIEISPRYAAPIVQSSLGLATTPATGAATASCAALSEPSVTPTPCCPMWKSTPPALSPMMFAATPTSSQSVTRTARGISTTIRWVGFE